MPVTQETSIASCDWRGGRVIGVDLKAPAQLPFDDLSADGVVPGWSAGLSRLLPFIRSPRIPSLVHLLAAATTVGTSATWDPRLDPTISISNRRSSTSA
jgi:hypothetical protein